MSANPFVLLSFLLSTLLAFFTAAIVIELIIRLIDIRRHRLRATLRLIPFFCLILDLLFNHYSIAKWINPLHCSSCVQKVLLEGVFPELKAHLSLTQTALITYMGKGTTHLFFSVLFVVFMGTSIFFVLRLLVQQLIERRRTMSILERGHLCDTPIGDVFLKHKLQSYNTKLYISNDINVPLAVFPNIIIIPQVSMEALSQDEFEAVVGHEIEHLQHRDPLVRLFYHLIATFFWWVPTQAWMKKIEYEQELACDQNALQYGVAKETIATALLKVAKQSKMQPSLCSFASSENSTVARIKTILGLNGKHSKTLFWLEAVVFFASAILLLMCTIG